MRPSLEPARTDVVRLVEGDFLDHADEVEDVAFCFLDAEKDVYEACYDVLVPKMVPGAILDRRQLHEPP